MDTSITNNSKEHRFHLRSQWKALFKSKFTHFSSWTPFNAYKMQVVAITKWLQSSYYVRIYVFQILCILSNNSWRPACFCTYRLAHYLYNGWKTSALIVKLLFWVGEKQSTSMPVINDCAVMLWMLNPRTTEYVNTEFCHIYLAVTSIGWAY